MEHESFKIVHTQEISKKFSNPRVYLQSSDIRGILEEHFKKLL